VPNAPTLEYIPQLDEITTAPMAILDGHGLAPETPGLGIAWNWDEIARRSVPGCSVTIAA
jgi:L-alanine-DL-glutamate epimerase-like enolase superfamily enzyme